MITKARESSDDDNSLCCRFEQIKNAMEPKCQSATVYVIGLFVRTCPSVRQADRFLRMVNIIQCSGISKFNIYVNGGKRQ